MDSEIFTKRCTGHGKQCYLKTGVNDGPNKGNSFLVCSSSSPCDFSMKIRVQPKVCSNHKEMVDLSHLVEKNGEKRIYQRCIVGKRASKWCSYKVIKQDIENIDAFSSQKSYAHHRALKDVNSREQLLPATNKPPIKTLKDVAVIGKEDVVSARPKTSLLLSHQVHSANKIAVSSGVNQSLPKTGTLSVAASQPLLKAGSSVSSSVLTSASNPYAAKVYIVNEIKKKTALLQMADRLPDKGMKIREQLAALENALKDLPDLSAEPCAATHKPLTSNLALTKHCDVQPMPIHSLKQMYASSSSAPQLYGGRMTAVRLQTVSTITTEAIEKLHKQLESRPGNEKEADDPSHLKVKLMTHQRQALLWMSWREKQTPSGGILADDMGLGKTLTMIALVMKDKQTRKSNKKDSVEWLSKEGNIIQSDATLVICPASIMHQWYKEVKARCNDEALTVILYHGDNRIKSATKLASVDIVITSYNLIMREVNLPESLKKDKTLQEKPSCDVEHIASDGLLARIGWRRIILDEAHNIKNYRSVTALCVCRLRAVYRWALTGTPIQNDLVDMYSLLKYLRCSPFDELKVWKRWVDNKQESGSQRLAVLVNSLLLRRTKDQKTSLGKALVSLPSKIVYTHELKLSGHEKAIYDQLFKKSKQVLVRYLENHTNNSVQDTALPPGGRIKGDVILLMLLRLRQCCSHPDLTKEVLNEEDKKEEGINLDLASAMKELDIQEVEKNETAARSASASCGSSKIDELMKKITEIKACSSSPVKFVVVSQWTSMLDIIARNLTSQKLRYRIIRGDIPPKTRSQMVEEFNTNPHGFEVMLVSLRAGGVGLNLIGGNHLFLLDLHWNPALELQACDRVYRVGQTRDVFIHKFVCKDTVEEKILVLQKNKTALADSALTGTKCENRKLSLKDLKALFGVVDP